MFSLYEKFVHHVRDWSHGMIEQYFRFSANVVADSWEPLHRFWELNLCTAIFLLPFFIILNLWKYSYFQLLRKWPQVFSDVLLSVLLLWRGTMTQATIMEESIKLGIYLDFQKFDPLSTQKEVLGHTVIHGAEEVAEIMTGSTSRREE